MGIVSKVLESGIVRRLRPGRVETLTTARSTVDRLAEAETEDELAELRDLLEAPPPQARRRRRGGSAPADGSIQRLTSPDAMLDDLLARAACEMKIRGTVDDISLDLLIRLVETDALSGRLWIRTAGELMTFDVRGGRIYRACSCGPDVPGERLGDILVTMGLVSSEEVEEELARSGTTGRPLGVGLLASGRVRVDQLKEALRRQSAARFDRALSDRTAAYAFGDKPPE